MPRFVLANTATAAYRRCYFDCRDATDGITAETGEAAGQPQISTNGGAWTNTGIGTLSAIGNGRYYADLTQAAVATAGDVIETRYKSANTAETPGDSFQVVAFDPNDAAALGLSRIDAAVSTRLASASYTAQTGDAYARLGAPAGASVSADIAAAKSDTAAIKLKTDALPDLDGGTVDASPAPTTTVFAASGASLNAVDNFYTTPAPMYLQFTGGAQKGRTAKLSAHDYTGGVHTFTLATALPAAPDAGDTFVLLGYGG